MASKVLTTAQITAYNNLNIRTYETPDGISGDRVIICLDGGGIRGILPIQLLKKMEEIAGIPLYAFCDLVAGTSTGAIIAGLIADGRTVTEIETFYINFVTKVFKKRGPFSNKAIDPPEYDKSNYRNELKTVLGDKTLQQVCEHTNVDLLISAKDMTDNEEAFFTCFNNNGYQGTYKDALLRIVMEATMSAPTYFKSLERFIDGGTTAYNNPSFAALIEALEYSGKGKYEADKVTIFSFGTGKTIRSITARYAENPGGVDVLFWFEYILATSNQDANSMQSDMFRSRIFKDIDYRRFQVSLDTQTMSKLPDRDTSALHGTAAKSLRALSNKDLDSITMDNVDKFNLTKEIGSAVVDYIMLSNKFRYDLSNTPTGRDELITAFDGIPEILANVTSAKWIDAQPTK